MITIIDDYYPNPDEIRKQALKLYFFPGSKGRRNFFAGRRTKQGLGKDNFIYNKNRFSQILGKKIVSFPTSGYVLKDEEPAFTSTSNGQFTLGLDTDVVRNWVHHDEAAGNQDRAKNLDAEGYAGVIYLTPNPELRAGTGLFRNVELGTNQKPLPQFICNSSGFKEEWQVDDSAYRPHTWIGNVYNRCIIYPQKYFHAPFKAEFGTDKRTGRLIQVFFFHVEKDAKV